ncbi:MAG: hypothetical protein K8I00_03915, partial [Candidatus Omnitrophica bacterium]|nr:hypothetical protein [Candidatus Omnitrophota bacterium]
MILTLEHETTYQYLDKVFLEPHVIRMTPRSGKALRVLESTLEIEPQPQGMNHILETDGSQSSLVWFSGMTNIFRVKARCAVELIAVNPFDFIIYPSTGLRVPILCPPDREAELAPYLRDSMDHPDIKAFGAELADRSGQQTVPFLTNLAQEIHEGFTYEKREHGQPHSAEHTFRQKKGSCRDFVVFAMAVCR